MDEKSKNGLKDIYDMSKVMVQNEVVVRSATGLKKFREVIYAKLASPSH